MLVDELARGPIVETAKLYGIDVPANVDGTMWVTFDTDPLTGWYRVTINLHHPATGLQESFVGMSPSEYYALKDAVAQLAAWADEQR